MILVINTCNFKLHEDEFVRPITDIIGKGYFVRHYTKITKKDLGKADKIIISGSALRDDNSINYDFSWVKSFNKPLLGICMGFEIIAKAFGGKLFESQEIGLTRIKITKMIPLLKNLGKEVYSLHNFSVKVPEEFEICAESNKKVVQVIKHKEKEMVGFAFHPEVMNKGVIKDFSLSD